MMINRIFVLFIGWIFVGLINAEEVDSDRLIPVVYSNNATINLPGLDKLHPFDLKKYDKIYRSLKNDNYLSESTTYKPEYLSRNDLLLVHTDAYLKRLNDKKLVAHYLEAPILSKIPWINIHKRIVQPFIRASGGTLKAARLAMKYGSAINLGGGYHHAKPNKGEGFCLIADVPIAIKKLQKEKLIKRALIIDTDIHQGNGTIDCLKNDPTTYTFSMHESGIYPIPKAVGDLDVSVPYGVTDKIYLKTLQSVIGKIFEESKPDIVFHISGCDALAGDPLANGKMSPAGIAARDLLIFDKCKTHNIPYVMTLAGGYSKEAWRVQLISIKGLMHSNLTFH